MRVIQCPEAASRGEEQAPHRPREALFLTTLMVLHVSSSSGIVIVLKTNTGSSILAGYHFYKWAQLNPHAGGGNPNRTNADTRSRAVYTPFFP